MMKIQNSSALTKNRKSQSGMTFVETAVALGILLVVATGVMGLGATALTTTENQGHLAARTAEYAQDKMEQLLALRFCDSASNTAPTVGYITQPAGGTGLAGCNFPASPAFPTALTGGGLNVNAPVAGYVDYLDASGNPVPVNGAWLYIRVWQITAPSPQLKQISVTAQVRAAVGGVAYAPNSTVEALKSYPF
jgi:hypothetical protein